MDTSALYALLVRNEERHAEVARAFERLAMAGRPMHTTSYCLLETAALLQHRIGLEPVHDLHEQLSPMLEIGWVDADLHLHGYRRLLRDDRRRVSLVDCVSFSYMETHGIPEALTLDAHFADAGFRVLPASRSVRGRGPGR